MSTVLWAAVLLGAVWAAHWGAEHLADPLKKLRRQWGFSVAAGGSFIGLATASPEVGINITSAFRGVADIGLGAMLGANIVVVPILLATAYLATRKKDLCRGHRDHVRHLREHFLPVDPGAVTVQALPYLGILVVVALLTLPEPWRGLQPIDGWILLIAYLAYLAQALLRGRKEGEQVEWSRRERWLGWRSGDARSRGLLHRLLNREDCEHAWHFKDHRRAVHYSASGGAAGGLRHVDPRAPWPDHGGRDRRHRRYGRHQDDRLHPAHDHCDADPGPASVLGEPGLRGDHAGSLRRVHLVEARARNRIQAVAGFSASRSSTPCSWRPSFSGCSRSDRAAEPNPEAILAHPEPATLENDDARMSGERIRKQHDGL